MIQVTGGRRTPLALSVLCTFVLAFAVMLLFRHSAFAQTATPAAQPVATAEGDTGITPLLVLDPEMQEQSVEVVGMQGVLRAASGQPFDTYLIDGEGRSFGLLGQDASIENQITALRRAGSAVRVWGTLFPAGAQSAVPVIVVSSISATGSIAPSTPTPTPQQGVVATVAYPQVNVRSGPDTAFPAIGVVTQGTTCAALGRNGNSSWLSLQCPAITGWVSAPLVNTTGNVVNLPVIPTGPPPATATPIPDQFPQWRASYFTNRNLAGAPALVRNETEVNFNWGYGSPSPGIPVDNFSARFERTIFFQTGTYNLFVTVDDGVRLWLNNELVIDDWRESSVRTLTVPRALSGNVNVRIEYFEAYNLAQIVFGYPLGSTAQPTPPPSVSELPPVNDQWAAAYWNNMGLSGAPVVARYEPRTNPPLNQNWGNGSPVPGVINNDNFSARWRGIFQFASGNYVFSVQSDDGVRVWLNDILVIDAWRDGYINVSNTFNNLGAGWHTIRIDYYENTGTANITFNWTRTGGGNSGGGNNGSGIVRDE